MAPRNPPTWLQTGEHPSEHDRLLLSALSDGRKGVQRPTHLKVTAGSGMQVVVARGGAFIPGTVSPDQGTYHVWNDGDYTIDLEPSDPTNPRISLIVARIGDTFYDAGAVDEWTLEEIAGTPAGSPIAPEEPENSLVLAAVLIAAGGTTPGLITDQRVYCPVGPAVGDVVFSARTDSTIAVDRLIKCDGSAISRTDYADLFEVIGTTYGAGDGATTFNLPDFRGRVPIGTGQGTGLTDRTLGATVGAETHQLTTAQMPQHNHSIAHDHPSATTSTDGDHTHAMDGDTGNRWAVSFAGAANKTSSTGNGDGITFSDIDNNGDHSHTFNVPSFSGNSGNAGSGQAHNNMQPSLAINVFIRY